MKKVALSEPGIASAGMSALSCSVCCFEPTTAVGSISSETVFTSSVPSG